MFSLLGRLRDEQTLDAHTGCVNRLAWNQRGTTLASVSDDRRLILWSYPDTTRRRVLATPHTRNIFGVRFLDDSSLVTGAMDARVCLFRLETGESQTFECHRDRVKAVDVDPTGPFVFFSASEDGTIRQFDTRLRHDCTDQGCSNVLIDAGPRSALEFKGLAVHPLDSFLLATAATDSELRLFDRRRLSVGARASNRRITQGLYKSVAPAHLRYGWPHESDEHVAIDSHPFDVAVGATVLSAAVVHAQSASEDRLVACHERIDQAEPSATGPTATTATTTTASNVSAASASVPIDGGGQPRPHASPYAGQASPRTPRVPQVHATHVGWSSTGHALVCTYNSEQCYVFHLDRAANHTARELSDGRRSSSAPAAVLTATHPRSAVYPLHAVGRDDLRPSGRQAHRAQTDKTTGNSLFGRKCYTDAIESYTTAIAALSPECGYDAQSCVLAAQLHANRAACFLKRAWRGDAAAALADARQALLFDPKYLKAHFRRGQALLVLGQLSAATQATTLALTQFPGAPELEGLMDEIRATHTKRRRERDSSDVVESDDDDDDDGEADVGNDREAMGDETAADIRMEQASIARQREYSARLVGHVNMATDIKEANFIFGDRFVAVGSDDGCVYIYDAHTGRLLQRIEHADPDVVNCVQGHPFEPVVASSGIAHCIKLWTPTADTPRPMPLATVAARQIEDNNQQMLRSLNAARRGGGGSGRSMGIPADVAAMLQTLEPEQLQAFFTALGARRMGAAAAP